MHSWLALYRATFSRDAMTVAERQAMIEVPLYRRNLDLVAEAPDRRLAAYCLCTISLEENTLTGRLVGYTDPHGTHPVYRHRGLPRALLLTGPWLLREQGVRTARL